MSSVKCIFLHKSTLTITWEGEPWRNVHTAIFGRKPIFPQCSTLDEFEQEFTKIEYKLAKAYAFRRLAAMSMLSTSLAKSLRTRFVSQDVTDRIINELVALGYLNDQEWTNRFVRVQTQKKMGFRGIAAKLASKGISAELFEEYTCDVSCEKDQRALIQELLANKYRSRNVSDFRERQKVVAALVRRGFEANEVLDVLRNFRT
jgi:regulatory protein